MEATAVTGPPALGALAPPAVPGGTTSPAVSVEIEPCAGAATYSALPSALVTTAAELEKTLAGGHGDPLGGRY